jgi:hypothetical protein
MKRKILVSPISLSWFFGFEFIDQLYLADEDCMIQIALSRVIKIDFQGMYSYYNFESAILEKI